MVLVCMQVPTEGQVKGLSEELKARAKLPGHVKGVLAALPRDTHPMVQFTVGIASLQVSRMRWQASQLMHFAPSR